MRKHVFLFLILLAGLCLFASDAFCETAPDITSDASISVSRGKKELRHVLDGDYRTHWSDKGANAFIRFDLPKDKPCYGLYVALAQNLTAFDLQVLKNGEWVTVPVSGERLNRQYLPVGEGATSVRLFAKKKGLTLCSVRLFGEGDLPSDVEVFDAPCEKADLMLIVTHPDDDILWFGGLLPTYAGELKMNVQVVYMTSHGAFRKMELLDGLWHCGVHNAPILAGFDDIPNIGKTAVFNSWGGKRHVVEYLAGLIRRFQPEVIVTQDEHGEYLHGAHLAMVSAVKEAVPKAADESWSGGGLPAWQTKKLYLHLYGKDPLILNWSKPLAAFGGETGMDLAREAYLCHVSQQNHLHAVEDSGPYDCRKMGLYFSSVGEDVNKDGLFEHIPALYAKEIGASAAAGGTTVPSGTSGGV